MDRFSSQQARQNRQHVSLPARLGQFVKILLGVVLIVLFFTLEGYGLEAFAILSSTQLTYVLGLLITSLLMNWISAFKWHLFARAQGLDVGLWRLTQLYLVGKFFNNFMPGMAGGDIARTLMLGNDIQSHTRAAASIFLERFTGLVCLLLMFGVALMFLPTAEGTAHSLLAYVGMATLAGCAGLLLVIYIPTVKTWGVGILSRIPWVKKLVPALDEVYQEVAALRYSPLLITTLLLSAIFYLLGSVSIFLASQAIGMQPVYFDVLLVTPIIYLVTLIPVSPNNIGWWEWSVGLLLQPAGLVISQGLAVGLLMRAVTMTVSLIGGVLFLDQRRKSTAHS